MENDRDKEGDVLILSPRRPEKRLADISFGKQIGRNDNELNEEFKV